MLTFKWLLGKPLTNFVSIFVKVCSLFWVYEIVTEMTTVLKRKTLVSQSVPCADEARLLLNLPSYLLELLDKDLKAQVSNVS